LLAPQFGIASERSSPDQASTEQNGFSERNAAQRNTAEGMNDEGRNSRERQNQRANAEQGEQMRQRNYLGIQVEAVRIDSMHNMPKQFLPGQGVRVVNVAAGSPADKTGIRTHDIVMCFDNQKLFASQQLMGLIRGEKSGGETELTILRNGKTQKIGVKLAEREWNRNSSGSESDRDEQAENRMGENYAESRWAENRWSNNNANDREEISQSNNRSARQYDGRSSVDDTFDSLTMESVGRNHFRVQIQYFDRNGRLAKNKFEGSLRDLRQQIDTERDIPQRERSQLFRSLELPVDIQAAPSVTFRTMPRGNERDRSDETL